MAILKLKNLLARTISGVTMGLAIIFMLAFHKGLVIIVALSLAVAGFFEIMLLNKRSKSIIYVAISLVLFIWAISSGIGKTIFLRKNSWGIS